MIHKNSNYEYTPKSPRTIATERAIEEVILNTPDSIELAIATLNSKNIEVPKELEELQGLHTAIQVGHTESFINTSRDLQGKVLSVLKKYILS